MKNRIFASVFLTCTGWLSDAALRADDWPMLGRDATRNPVSSEKNPPTWWQVEVTEKGQERPATAGVAAGIV